MTYYPSKHNGQKQIYSLTKEELAVAAIKAGSFTQLVKNLGFADGDTTRLKLKSLVSEHNIDISHFSSRKKAAPDEIKRARRKVSTDKSKARKRSQRRNRETHHIVIYEDCRRSDSKFGRKNDLTIDYVQEMIAKGCHYCGEDQIRMTLDRIDNSMGHTKENTIPACIRCNLIRRDMPYEIWEEIAKTLRSLKESGKLDWIPNAKTWWTVPRLDRNIDLTN